MLKNKIIAITGGASGIGYAIASIFIENNAQIAIFDSDSNRLEHAKKALGNDMIYFQGNVANISDLNNFFNIIEHHYRKKIDVVVANAGIGNFEAIQDVTEASFDKMIDTNLKGVYFTVQKSLPYLNSVASIILISSIASRTGFANNSVYSATKAAVSILAKCFSADLIGRGIRVNAISPGNTLTPMLDQVKQGKEANFLSKLENLTPLQRFADSKEIGELALFLASDKSSYIVGEDIAIDGGITNLFPVIK